MQNVVTMADVRAQRRVRAGLHPRIVDPSSPIHMGQSRRTPEGARSSNKSTFSSIMPDGTWKGRRCFIVAGGPSLRGFDWTKLDGEIVIAVNRAFEFCNPTVCYSMDTRFWSWVEKKEFGSPAWTKYRDMPGFKCFLDTTGFPFTPDVYIIPNGGANLFTSSIIDGLSSGQNSGHGAVNLAYLMGADPIYLLGYDMRSDVPIDNQWFHTGYPSRNKTDIYPRFAQNMNEAAAMLPDRGRIINLNPDSGLKCFPFGSISDVKAISRPVVVSFYTPEYVEEANKLNLSLARYGYPRDIQLVDLHNQSWERRTCYKPKFILEMMKRHPGQPLVWVDADAEFLHYPDLFDNFSADGQPIAAHLRHGYEFLSGTVWFDGSERCKEIVEAWATQAAAQTTWDQRILQRILQNANDYEDLYTLPVEYCSIFDGRDIPPRPVILHNQASRKHRADIDARACGV